MSEGIMVDFSNPTIFFWPSSVSQYASIDPTIPPTPTITTSASVGNLEDFFGIFLLLIKFLYLDSIPHRYICPILYAFAIPHNSNTFNGRMFSFDYPENSGVDEERARAALRIKSQPIIEIMQHKGDSECRDGVPGVMDGEDELCNWEKFEDLALNATGGGGDSSESPA